MSMIVPEAAESGASKFGLTGGQKASAGLGAVPTAKTSHPYVVGIALVLIGGFGLVGSIIGALPSMLAALFVPNALIDSGGNQKAPSPASLTAVNPLTSSPTLCTPLTVGTVKDVYNWTIVDPSNWLNNL